MHRLTNEGRKKSRKDGNNTLNYMVLTSTEHCWSMPVIQPSVEDRQKNKQG